LKLNWQTDSFNKLPSLSALLFTIATCTGLSQRNIDYTAPIVAFWISSISLAFGLYSRMYPSNVNPDAPIEAYFFFAALAFTTMLLDINHLRVRGYRGVIKSSELD